MTVASATTRRDTRSRAQSLATGPVGTALLTVEQALCGTGDWGTAARAIGHAAAGDIDASTRASLYYGAPAIRLLLHAAQADGQPRYHRTTRSLDRHIARLVHRRLDAAAERGERHGPADFREYDLFYGVTGLASLLLRTAPGSDVLGRALTYLTELTRPRRDNDGILLPGWWVPHDPDPGLPTPGGHANFGMAHGAAGILAVLALATIRGQEVAGQLEAIEQLTTIFNQWRRDGSAGPFWPQWVTRTELRDRHSARHRPGRLSWCYGAVGIARALQLAAISTADRALRRQAEADLAAILTSANLRAISEPGLCHGIAGIYQTAGRAAHDTATPLLASRLPGLAAQLTHWASSATGDDHQADGLLTGRTGISLAHLAAQNAAPPRSGWDTCLLIA